ncbi:MAG: hypothetical protein LBT30_06210 [Clostridiales bacterium]|nr:hypothetical protein [Clostridiales bacterium]
MALRYTHDERTIADASGDGVLWGEAQTKIRVLSKHYRDFSNAANIFYQEPLTDIRKDDILSSGSDSDDYDTRLDKTFEYSPKNLREEVTKAEAEIGLSEVENAYVYTADGKAYKLIGSRYAVDPSIVGAEALKGATVTHNHPHDERGPSKEDFYVAAKNQIKELRTVDRTRTYVLKFESVTEEDIKTNIKEATMNMYQRRMNGEDGDDQTMIAEELAKLIKGLSYENMSKS